jgi:hypothetical protein
MGSTSDKASGIGNQAAGKTRQGVGRRVALKRAKGKVKKPWAKPGWR